jgi:hypothetical protein
VIKRGQGRLQAFRWSFAGLDFKFKKRKIKIKGRRFFSKIKWLRKKQPKEKRLREKHPRRKQLRKKQLGERKKDN